MPIEDRGDDHYTPESGGGKESGTSLEVNVVDAAKGWRWFWKWVRGEKVEMPREPPAKSWTQQKEEENARKADEATANVCQETDNQRRLRERENT